MIYGNNVWATKSMGQPNFQFKLPIGQPSPKKKLIIVVLDRNFEDSNRLNPYEYFSFVWANTYLTFDA